jgi:hypothetical protein
MSTAAAMMNAAVTAPSGGCAGHRNCASQWWTCLAESGASPHQSPGGEGDKHYDRHEHAADAVSKTLDVRAAGLGALHGGDDVRQRRGFASCGDAHHEAAVQVHRARAKFASCGLVHGHGFASEHGFIHGGIAFHRFTVSGNVVAGPQRHQIADAQFGHGNFGLFDWSDGRRSDPTRGLRGEIQQRF